MKGAPSATGALAATIDRTVFPGVQGGPLMHVIAGKAVAFQLALGEEFRRDQQRTIENAATIAAVLAERGFRVVSGGTDNHLMLVDVMSRGRDRQGRRAPPRRDRDHRQQEPDPVRPAAAEHLVGDPGRDAGGHLTRDGPRRDARDRGRSSPTRSSGATTPPRRPRWPAG